MELIMSLLPIILILVIWLIVMVWLRNKSKSNNFIDKQDEIISMLKEIKEEIKDLKAKNSEKKF